MSFWEKIKQAVRSFMAGRNGADQLSMALLWGGLLLYLLGSIVGSVQGSVIWALLSLAFSMLGFASYIFCIFRTFSRNRFAKVKTGPCMSVIVIRDMLRCQCP